jgi:hypothetical protein
VLWRYCLSSGSGSGNGGGGSGSGRGGGGSCSGSGGVYILFPWAAGNPGSDKQME